MANELKSTTGASENIIDVTRELDGSTNSAQALIEEGREQGRKEEALRMTRVALQRRFGGLDQYLSQALERLDTAALEDLAWHPPLTIEQLHARLEHHPEGSPPTRRGGIRDSQGKPVRLSPLGGYLKR